MLKRDILNLLLASDALTLIIFRDYPGLNVPPQAQPKDGRHAIGIRLKDAKLPVIRAEDGLSLALGHSELSEPFAAFIPWGAVTDLVCAELGVAASFKFQRPPEDSLC